MLCAIILTIREVKLGKKDASCRMKDERQTRNPKHKGRSKSEARNPKQCQNPNVQNCNREDHERRNTMHDTGCTMQVKEASLTLFPDTCTLFF